MATAAAANKNDQPATRFAKDHLKAFVERIERLEEEKKALADDIRDVYAEAKATGFDVKALRTIVRDAQGGRRRAQGARGDPGDLPACARHAELSVGSRLRRTSQCPRPPRACAFWRSCRKKEAGLGPAFRRSNSIGDRSTAAPRCAGGRSRSRRRPPHCPGTARSSCRDADRPRTSS